jgi:hypothetical protein
VSIKSPGGAGKANYNNSEAEAGSFIHRALKKKRKDINCKDFIY